jgi:hypothetical protein
VGDKAARHPIGRKSRGPPRPRLNQGVHHVVASVAVLFLTSGLVPIALVVALVATIGVLRALQVEAFRSIQLASTLAQVTKCGREFIDRRLPRGARCRIGNSALECRAVRRRPRGRLAR